MDRKELENSSTYIKMTKHLFIDIILMKIHKLNMQVSGSLNMPLINKI